MDEDQFYIQVQKCKHLKFKFRAVFAVENYPSNLAFNSFKIVNASRADSIGSHWVMLAKRYTYPVLYFALQLALPLTVYKDSFSRLQQCNDLRMMMDIIEHRRDIQSSLQSADSQLCCFIFHLYCSLFLQQ